MFLTVKLISQILSLILSFTAITSITETVCRHYETAPPSFTYTVRDLIENTLSLLPDGVEYDTKNMLTAIENAVSDITENIIDLVNS